METSAAEGNSGTQAGSEVVPAKPAEAAPSPEPRQIAPIKPIPPTKVLPGVNLKTEADEDLRKALSRDRDKGGRFEKEDVLTRAAKREAKPEKPQEKPVAQDGAPQDEGEPKVPELPAGEKPQAIKFAGKEYKDLAEIEQAHKSLQGMFRSHQDQVKKVTEERDYGYRAAAAWTDHAKKLEARVAELEASLQGGKAGPVAGAGPQAADSDEMPSVDSILDEIDTDVFEQVALQGGLPHAGKYLAGEILKVVSSKLLPALQARVDKRFAPVDQQQQSQHLMETISSVRTQVASLKTLDGKDAFPELNDPNLAHEVGRVWSEAGLPPEVAMTPQGLINAVALYRLMKGLPTGEAPAAIEEAKPSPGPAASVSADNRVAPPNKGRSNLSPEAQRLVDAINSPDLVDPVLGFPRRRR